LGIAIKIYQGTNITAFFKQKNDNSQKMEIVANLKRQHPSRPRNLLIADVCFKAGYIDAWGSGTLKIISTCKEAGLPDPEIIEQDGGILVTLFKNKYSADQLQKLGLNERQVKAVLYVVENGSITSSVYQKHNAVGRTAAAMDLQELVAKGILIQLGLKGRGIKYVLFDN
jgi:ATP-dependent DNA helicase RecG